MYVNFSGLRNLLGVQIFVHLGHENSWITLIGRMLIMCWLSVCQKKDGEDKKVKNNGDAKVGSGRTIPLKQVQDDDC